MHSCPVRFPVIVNAKNPWVSLLTGWVILSIEEFVKTPLAKAIQLLAFFSATEIAKISFRWSPSTRN